MSRKTATHKAFQEGLKVKETEVKNKMIQQAEKIVTEVRYPNVFSHFSGNNFHSINFRNEQNL